MKRVARNPAGWRNNMAKQTNWKKVTEGRYLDMLEAVPPAYQCTSGFLVGEARSHRQCAVTGNPGTSTFGAFIERSDGFYECTEALTYREYRAIDPHRIKVLEEA